MKPVFWDTAYELGKLMGKAQHHLINGAGRTGLMNACAEGVLQHGGTVTGVIPQFMIDENWHRTDLTQLHTTATMHERKAKMAELSDACIACPGGVGTLEELLEVITWKQLGLYTHPIVILNTEGFYDGLITQLEHCISERFMRTEHGQLWCVAQTPAEALYLCEHTPDWDRSWRTRAMMEADER